MASESSGSREPAFTSTRGAQERGETTMAPPLRWAYPVCLRLYHLTACGGGTAGIGNQPNFTQATPRARCPAPAGQPAAGGAAPNRSRSCTHRIVRTWLPPSPISPEWNKRCGRRIKDWRIGRASGGLSDSDSIKWRAGKPALIRAADAVAAAIADRAAGRPQASALEAVADARAAFAAASGDQGEAGAVVTELTHLITDLDDRAS